MIASRLRHDGEMTSTRHSFAEMGIAGDSESAVESTVHIARPLFGLQPSEPALLDNWRVERRVSDSQPLPNASDWRSAVPAELFDRLRSRGVASAAPVQPLAAEAGQVPLPAGYRAPFLPEPPRAIEAINEALGWDSDPDLLSADTIRIKLPSAFQGLDWSPADSSGSMLLVSVRPILDAALADKVVELLDKAPGMSRVRSLGSTEDVAAFEADYDGPVTRMEAVSQALKGIGASLVSTGDREFYLAIQGQYVS
jgi:hypothetical protein